MDDKIIQNGQVSSLNYFVSAECRNFVPQIYFCCQRTPFSQRSWSQLREMISNFQNVTCTFASAVNMYNKLAINNSVTPQSWSRYAVSCEIVRDIVLIGFMCLSVYSLVYRYLENHVA